MKGLSRMSYLGETAAILRVQNSDKHYVAWFLSTIFTRHILT